jgi:hypothetical protein
MLIESLLPARGACLLVGKPKSGKTLLGIQMAIAVASGSALFGNYRVLGKGPALVLEQDDPAGAASVQGILKVSPVPIGGIPFYLAPQVPFTFGPELLEWLEGQISALELRLVVLDSYTALRAARGASVDIVKVEQTELRLLDGLAKQTGCTILVVHHGSKGSAAMDWTEQAAGTFAMGAAVESQVHITRFKELSGTAPERLVRVRGRHLDGVEMVLRFRKESLDYEYVVEGGAAELYPLILQLQNMFGHGTFGPKDLQRETAVSPATATRQIGRLHHGGVLERRGHGEYVLAVSGVRELRQ